MAKEVFPRQFGNAACNAAMDVGLREKIGEADGVLIELPPEVGAADSPCSRGDGLPLYQCVSPDVLVCFGSLWQGVNLAGTHWRRPVHC